MRNNIVLNLRRPFSRLLWYFPVPRKAREKLIKLFNTLNGPFMRRRVSIRMDRVLDRNVRHLLRGHFHLKGLLESYQ